MLGCVSVCVYVSLLVCLCHCQIACKWLVAKGNAAAHKSMLQFLERHICVMYTTRAMRKQDALTYPDLELDTLVMPKDRLDLEVDAHG